MEPVRVGILGCGTISDAYLGANDRFEEYDIVACTDLDMERAEATAAEYGIEALESEAFVESDVELVVNLTPPSVHEGTCERMLAAGKHVYVEKPLAASVSDAAGIRAAADDADLLVGSAPDTFLGAGLQTCRRVIDEGRIGEPVGATAVWTSPGHETWHPNPDLYYKEGGGPLFDMGPYYVTALVTLLGAAERVTGSVTRAHDTRTITSEPRAGEEIDVEVPTHESGVIDFGDGTVANVTTSFDAQDSTLPDPAFEIYGTEGTLAVPDPNHFEGPVRVSDGDGFETVEMAHDYTAGRGAGVADLARAIRDDGWTHRTNADLAYHVLEILDGVRVSAERGEHVTVESTPERPAPLPEAFPDDRDE